MYRHYFFFKKKDVSSFDTVLENLPYAYDSLRGTYHQDSCGRPKNWALI